MLKHVQTSPHRNFSSSSLKRLPIDEQDEDVPKHLRQVSTPASLFVPRPSTSPSGSESSVPQTGVCCRMDPSSVSFQFRVSDNEELISFPTKGSTKPPEVTVQVMDKGYLRDIKKCEDSSSSESVSPLVICPNCHKKKKLPVMLYGQGKQIGCSPQRAKRHGVPTSVTSLTCEALDCSLRCTPVKSGSSCICSTDYLQRHLCKDSLTHPRPSSPKIQRNSSPSSGLSSFSPSSSTSSLSSSSKSPQSYLRTKHQRRIEDKVGVSRCDDVSLDSSMSCSTTSHEEQMCSLSSSSISLHDTTKHTTVRIWVRCLLQEMEYKTLSVSYSTTCRQIVSQLLSKFRMKHRDPNLFYLAMEVTIRKAGTEVRTCLRLEDSAYPAQLVECHPKEDSRLALRMRRGGLLRIYDEAVSQGSYYKSLLVGEKTCCAEVVSLVLACNKVMENCNNFSLFEVWPNERRERVLHPDEEPMVIASQWPDKESVRFEVRQSSKPSNHRQPSIDAIIQSTLNGSTENGDTATSRDLAKTIDENCKGNGDSPTDDNANLNRSLKPLLSSNSVKLKTKRKERSRSGCFDNFHFHAKEKLFGSNLGSSDESSSGFPSISSISTSPDEQKDNQINISGLRGKLVPPAPERNLLETPVDENTSMELTHQNNLQPSKTRKTYNDYENYFYI